MAQQLREAPPNTLSVALLALQIFPDLRTSSLCYTKPGIITSALPAIIAVISLPILGEQLTGITITGMAHVISSFICTVIMCLIIY